MLRSLTRAFRDGKRNTAEYPHTGETDYNKVSESHGKGNHAKQVIGSGAGTGKAGDTHVLTVGMWDHTGTTE